MAIRTITGLALIKSSLRVLGAYDRHTTLTDEEADEGLEALIMLIEQLAGPPNGLTDIGLSPWLSEIATLTLTAKASFDLKATGGDLDIEVPESIITATRRTTDTVDAILNPMTLEEYNAISNKGQTSTPTRYYYEREKDNGLFKLNYIPADITDTVVLNYRRRIESPTLTGNIDLPDVSFRALKFNLAIDLAPEKGKKVSEELLLLALQSRKKLAAYFPVNANHEMYFQPGMDR